MVNQQLKSAIRHISAWTYYTSRHFLNRLRGKVLILAYHRVLSEKELTQDQFIQPGMYVRKDVFEKQIRYLKEYFQLLSFNELLRLWRKSDWDQRKRYCVVTFDDGWLDNYTHAYPILREYSIPATIFLPTGFIGTTKWFWPDKLGYLLRYSSTNAMPEERKSCLASLDRWHPLAEGFSREDCNGNIDSLIEACKGLPEEEICATIEQISRTLDVEFPNSRAFLDWREVKEMSRHGISFGSHSCTHKILTKLPPGEIKNEIEDSLHALQEKEINYIPVFCYPNGNYTPEIAREVKAAGYEAAVSTQFGFEDNGPEDLFRLKRIGLHNDISATIPLFTFHIAGLNQLSTVAS